MGRSAFQSVQLLVRSWCSCSGKHARSLQPGVWTASPPTSRAATEDDLTAEGTQRRSGSENDNYELYLLHISKANAKWSQKSMKAVVYYVRRHTSMMSSGRIRLHGFCLSFRLGIQTWMAHLLCFSMSFFLRETFVLSSNQQMVAC